MSDTLTIALSKGRIYKDTLPLLEHAGIRPMDDPVTSRKLILDTNQEDVKLVIIRATDVPTFVEYGAADIGVAGKDVLLEYSGEALYEPLDLNIARCRMMVAGFADARPRATSGHLRIATKYPDITRRYYASKGQQVEVIKLYGAMELAPIVGLADYIVDLVETGNTLKANGLMPLETIADISSRLVVGKAAMKTKNAAIKRFIASMSEAVEQHRQADPA
jgi:ATP phosphoribosyltransferase